MWNVLVLSALALAIQAPMAAQQKPQSEGPRFPEDARQDALSYHIHLDVQPAAKQLSGKVLYHFRADQPLSSIRLHALRSEHWQPSFKDAEGQPMPAKWGKDHVVLDLGDEVAAGTELHFSCQLQGSPPDGFYFKPSCYGDPVAFTDHYSIRARGWLPCEDHPSDRAQFRLTLTYPEGLEVMASGVPLPVAATPGASIRDASTGTALLQHQTLSDIPPYMLTIVVGDFALVEEEGDARLAPHLVYPQDLKLAKSMLVHHAKWLQLMEQAFGPYAYGKYQVAQCPTRWGGFEGPGNVLLAEKLFAAGERGMGIMAHELAHMWFGDGVGYRQWHEVWLSEGFASYFGPWLHAQTGGPSLQDSLQEMRQRWLVSRDGRIKTVRWDGFPHPDQALNDNTYPKGAWILHMLRLHLGEKEFFAALNKYYQKHQGASVVTKDFVACIEDSTGQELDWFFEQWLDRVGCPELKVAVEDGQLVVMQVQKAAPYRFPLRLQWQDDSGNTVTKLLQVTERRSQVQVEGSVQNLQLDPQVELLFRAKP